MPDVPLCGMRLLPESSRLPEFGKRTNSLFCLAPQGVFLAIRLTPDPVGSYPAISPLPSTILKSTRSMSADQHQNRAGRYVFCDTIRQLELTTELPAFSHGMLLSWCSDFPLLHLLKCRSDRLLTQTV